jgi:ABC-2 type transport system ATP-binding protein
MQTHTEPPAEVLAYERVVKSYGAHVALNDVSLSVQAGEVFGLLGPNGAGKTSLIRLALDIVRPDSGEVRVFGAPPNPGVLDRVSYLPEERGLYKKQKILEVLVYLGELKGLGASAARSAALSWLERIGLAHVANQRVETLSKGLSQKVQLAAALLSDPPLAILDEPFSGLDPLNARLVTEVIEERRARGQTTVLSTHQMDRAENLCDRIVLISHGEVLLAGTVPEIRRGHASEGETPSLETVFVEAIARRSRPKEPS